MEKAVSQILCFFIYGNSDSFDVNAPQRRLDVPAVPSKHELIVSIRPLTSGLDHTVSRLQMSSEVQTHPDEPLGASICVQIFFADWRFDLGEILTYKFQHIRSRFENLSEGLPIHKTFRARTPNRPQFGNYVFILQQGHSLPFHVRS